MKGSRRAFISAIAAAVMLVGLSGSAMAQPVAGDSLVNVQISGVEVLVPIGVAANLCDVNANILAQQERDGGASCEATADSVASPGQSGRHGHGPKAGNSLVNVQISDVFVAVPIAVAANICDVNVNVLATQIRDGGATCEAAATSQA